MARSQPLVIAHRGYSGAAPENTLPAFRMAKAGGADMVELDYYHTKDGQMIVIHDKTLDRTTDAVAALTPRHLHRPDPAARDWALQVAIAGLQNGAPVRLTVQQGDAVRDISFVPGIDRPATLVTATRLPNDVAVIRLNNSLGERDTVGAFDVALERMQPSSLRGQVLDLRDTPSGGNSLVARGIMGRLISTPAAYQMHEWVAEGRQTGVRRVWQEWVHPRGSNVSSSVKVPVVVLVSYWTGSMGEGMAIGLNAAGGARVVGTPMAGLLGALGEETLPNSRIKLRVPVEKLFHVNGTPREAFQPESVPASIQGEDPALTHALNQLR